MTEQDLQGEEIVRRHAMYAAGVGLIPVPLGGYMSTRVGYGFGGGLIRAIPVVGQVLGAAA